MHNARESDAQLFAQGTALCACGVPPLLRVPGGGGCVSGAGYQHSAKVDDVRRYPSVGRNEYNDEVRWFEATYDYLEAQLDDAERAKRMLPAKTQRRGGRSATSAPAAPAVPSRGGAGSENQSEGHMRG